MRELKFRAWGKDIKKFLYIELGPNARIRDNIWRYYSSHDDWEQYTGLKDKNGKEIYEGDIVNAVGIGIAQVIDSPSGEWMLYYKREPDEIKNGFACVVSKNKPSGLWKTTLTSYIEIVGNIHENPWLVEEEE